jgi:hypothetical protein
MLLSTDEPTVRGVPLWLLRRYLLDLGATPTAPDCLSGPNWQVKLVQIEDYEIGSLRVGQVRLSFTGEAAGIAEARRALAPRLLRAGG